MIADLRSRCARRFVVLGEGNNEPMNVMSFVDRQPTKRQKRREDLDEVRH